METKKCFKCKIEKSLNQFRHFKSGKNKNYYYSYCKECQVKYQLEAKIKYPWYKTYHSILNRCYGKNRYYKNKNIRNFLKIKDLKFLWFRDKAYLLKNPSIDRITNNGDYALDNCRFIELTENYKRKN